MDRKQIVEKAGDVSGQLLEAIAIISPLLMLAILHGLVSIGLFDGNLFAIKAIMIAWIFLFVVHMAYMYTKREEKKKKEVKVEDDKGSTEYGDDGTIEMMVTLDGGIPKTI